ncbi:hypothetical protein G6321_00025720 [Bradyrhizobium barranii subsp. barranii]|uniref:Uncharacterized protein n=1 Tax=Bradyrhizobium barranii subsp. barranii TaxID=2823807 RepID=A0A7Z0QJ36_9BRAD|nr:hypothetical protein [Bradyrhizobium barranii]UGX98331.1 hypothetical protein G6321_00025720 [Bradyrhizobium barranii subsp. barranii]
MANDRFEFKLPSGVGGIRQYDARSKQNFSPATASRSSTAHNISLAWFLEVEFNGTAPKPRGAGSFQAI